MTNKQNDNQNNFDKTLSKQEFWKQVEQQGTRNN